MSKTADVIKELFKNREQVPFEATEGQCEIFRAIVDERIKRVAVRAVTQYGKSDITSMALVFLLAEESHRKKILLVSPSGEQSGIIMGDLIEHIFDSDGFVAQVEIQGSLDRFKRERSKNKIDWKTGSSIKILTADARTVSKEAKSLMGFGADIVIVDESGLIPDKMYAKILRMVGGVKNGKLVQLGNPFERNHFYKAFQSPLYHKIIINWKQALAEGRITQDFLDEAKKTIDPIDWQVFYECEFPEDTEDSLIPYKQIESAINRDVPDGSVKFGIDLARFGADKSILCKRLGNKVVPFIEWVKKDTMESTGIIRNEIDNDNPTMVNIDVVGLGSGVVDRLIEEDYNVNGINFGDASVTNERCSNVRAEAYWGCLRPLFLNEEISIPNDPELIEELMEQKYTFNSKGQVVLEDKEKLKARLGRSPDKADALALAFLERSPVRVYPTGTIA